MEKDDPNTHRDGFEGIGRYELILLSVCAERAFDACKDFTNILKRTDIIDDKPNKKVVSFGFEKIGEALGMYYFVGDVQDYEQEFFGRDIVKLIHHYCSGEEDNKREVAEISTVILMIVSASCHFLSLLADAIRKSEDILNTQSQMFPVNMEAIRKVMHRHFFKIMEDLWELIDRIEPTTHILFSSVVKQFSAIANEDDDKKTFIVTFEKDGKSYDIRADYYQIIIIGTALETLRAIQVENASGGSKDVSDLFVNLLQEVGIASP